MDKVCIALIHNNDDRRNSYIRPRLVGLQAKLSKDFKVDLLAVGSQPPIKAHGLLMALSRSIYYGVLDYAWRRYRCLPSFFLGGIASVMRTFLKSGGYTKGNWRRSSAIEMVVTDKHIRAWGAFLETGADFLICFEDDAVFRNDSSERLADLLGMLVSKTCIYADLAGGVRLRELQLDELQIKQDGAFRYYRKPVTNTACAYLMSRPLVVTLYGMLVAKPWLRLIGIDWMMNTLFILMEKAGISCECMHADTTIFCHGSVTGEYAPWSR